MIYRNRLALVVGGSLGIGRAIGEALLDRQCHVVLAARRLEHLQAAQRDLFATPARLTTCVMDVTQPASVKQGIAHVVKREGVPDFVFNCAGLAHPAWFADSTEEAFEEMMRVNYFGTVAVCRALVPLLLARGGGHIINTASLGGLFGLFGYTGYCASKHAVVGFTESLRRELRGSGVRVSLLCPPNTRTPGLEQENREKPPEVLAQEEKVRVVEPAWVAHRLLQALPSNPAVFIPTLDGRIAWWLSRWAPWALDRLLARPRG